jgi:trimethylamine--corrinoid protein Co-methyltransferase
MTGMLPALAGANVIYGSGMLEMGITFDLAQLVIDNEIAGMIKYALNGITVNDETLSVDVIKEMGIGKDYLAHETTFKHMKSQSQSDLIDRRMREDWEASGSTDIKQRAGEKVIHILENHEPAPLPDDVRAGVRSIVIDAEKEMGVY